MTEISVLESCVSEWQFRVPCLGSLKAHWAITTNAASSRAYGVGRASAPDNRHFLCLAIVFLPVTCIKGFRSL